MLPLTSRVRSATVDRMRMLAPSLRASITFPLRATPFPAAALLMLVQLGCAQSHSALDASVLLVDMGHDAPDILDAEPDLATPDGCVPFVRPSCAQEDGLFPDQPYTHLVAFENTAFATFIGLTLTGSDASGCGLLALSMQRLPPYEGTQEVIAIGRGPSGDTMIPGQVRIGSYESSYMPRADGSYGRLTGTLLLRFPAGPQAMAIDVPICELRASP